MKAEKTIPLRPLLNILNAGIRDANHYKDIQIDGEYVLKCKFIMLKERVIALSKDKTNKKRV